MSIKKWSRWKWLVLMTLWIGVVWAENESQAVRQDDARTDATQEKGEGDRGSDQKDESDSDVEPPHEQVTVTASRTEVPLRNVTQSVTVVTSDQMEQQGARTVAQVLETIPGFALARSGGPGGVTSAFVRGGESNFNLVLIDGVQVNQPGGAFDFADLATRNIERIEVVRGPSGVLYGSEAVTSTIQIFTRKGADRLSGDAAGEGGSFRTALARGGVSLGSQRGQLSVGGQWNETAGFYDFNGRHRNGQVVAAGSLGLSNSSTLEASLFFQDSETGIPTDGTGAVVDPNDFQQTRLGSYTVRYRNQLTDVYQTRVQYGYYRRDFESFTAEDGISDFFSFDFAARDDRHFLDWQNDLAVHRNHLLTAGVSYKREGSRTVGEHRRGVGVYVQDQFNWKERVLLTAGVRFDHNDRFENFLTGSLAAGVFVTERVKIRGSFGNGFRAPAFDDIIGFPAFGIRGNPALKPEKNIAADVGFDIFLNRAIVSATLFRNRFSDLIEFTFAVPPGEPNYQNIEEAQSSGLELEAKWQVVPGFQMGAQFTLTDTEVLESGSVAGGAFAKGEALLRRPRHLANLFGTLVWNRLQARLDFRYKGSREDLQFFPDFSSSRVTLPGFWKVDFGLTIPLVRFADAREVSATLRGENLFAERYQEVAGFDSPGRSVQAGLRVRF